MAGGTSTSIELAGPRGLDAAAATDAEGRETVRAFLATQAERDAVTLEEAGVLRVDVPTATERAIAGATRAQQFAEAIALLPVPPDLLERVHRYALATVHAHVLHLVQERPPSPIAPMVAELTELRRTYLTDTRALVRRKLIDRSSLKGLSSTRGHIALGFDVMLLCSLLTQAWPRIEGRTAVRVEELAHAHKLAVELIKAVGLRDDRKRTRTHAFEERTRAFFLLARTYEQLRRCLLFILGSQARVNEIAPAFIMGRSRKYAKRLRRAAAEESGT